MIVVVYILIFILIIVDVFIILTYYKESKERKALEVILNSVQNKLAMLIHQLQTHDNELKDIKESTDSNLTKKLKRQDDKLSDVILDVHDIKLKLENAADTKKEYTYNRFMILGEIDKIAKRLSDTEQKMREFDDLFLKEEDRIISIIKNIEFLIEEDLHKMEGRFMELESKINIIMTANNNMSNDQNIVNDRICQSPILGNFSSISDITYEIEKITPVVDTVVKSKVNDQNETVQDVKERNAELDAENNIAIKYTPNSQFEQLSRPFFFPIVKMPPANSIIKYPLQGRKRNKGISEKYFHYKLLSNFKKKIKRNFLLNFDGAKNDYEPDFTFVDDQYGLFLDIEIDEPYSGISRQPMHFEGSYDLDRDSYFNRNGWIVIRIAEEQVVKYPEICCHYIAKVVNSIIPDYSYDDHLAEQLTPIKQWTYEEAIQIARANYRESYLGVEFIHEVVEPISIESESTKPADEIPYNDLVSEIEYRDTAALTVDENALIDQVENLMSRGDYFIATFQYINTEHFVKILALQKERTVNYVKGYDYICNSELLFEISKIKDFNVVDKPFLFSGEHLTAEQFKEQIEMACDNQLYVQINYQKYGGEHSVRTISHFQRVLIRDEENWWYTPDLYVRAYCHLRSEERTFKFERILYMNVLNYSY